MGKTASGMDLLAFSISQVQFYCIARITPQCARPIFVAVRIQSGEREHTRNRFTLRLHYILMCIDTFG